MSVKTVCNVCGEKSTRVSGHMFRESRNEAYRCITDFVKMTRTGSITVSPSFILKKSKHLKYALEQAKRKEK